MEPDGTPPCLRTPSSTCTLSTRFDRRVGRPLAISNDKVSTPPSHVAPLLPQMLLGGGRLMIAW